MTYKILMRQSSTPSRMPIRILVVAPSLKIVGGQSIQADALIRGLNRERNVEVALAATDPPLPEVLRRIKYLRTTLKFLLFFPLILMRIWRYDILQVFTPAGPSYFLWSVPAMAIGRLAGKRVILHYHDGRGSTHFAQSRFAVWTSRMAHVLVTPSEYLSDAFARCNVPAVPIPNLVDPSFFKYRTRDRLRPVFFTNRGLEPLYNVGCVLRAFSAIQQRYPDARLTVAHDGPSRCEMEELASTLQLANVTFTGTVSQQRMVELYDASDIYLMSPDIDNMPGTVLECYASGIPVVSTKAGGVPYIVRDEFTGLLVNCGDWEALARSACRLLADPALALRLARNGRAECSRYTWEVVRPQWLQLYAELLGFPVPESARSAASA